jgi:16S rRNA (cytosine1402-N4)-methyltransferase
MTQFEYHRPVMAEEAIAQLNIDENGTYVDLTFGGGGHSSAIMARLSQGRLFAFDQDSDALANVPKDERFVLIAQNFRYLKNNLRIRNAIPVDGILGDLGVSSHQFDTPRRGFSTRFEGPLDMRMNPDATLSAAQVVNEYEEEALTSIFRQYGELPAPHKFSRSIVKARSEKPIETTVQLIDSVRHLSPPHKLQGVLARLFQAIRIEVNQEMDALREVLEQSLEVLKPGGRMVFISYHSLEDRMIKHFFRSGNFEGVVEKDFYGVPQSPLKPLFSKALVPSEEEIKANPRARSARLRAAQKCDANG